MDHTRSVIYDTAKSVYRRNRTVDARTLQHIAEEIGLKLPGDAKVTVEPTDAGVLVKLWSPAPMGHEYTFNPGPIVTDEIPVPLP